MGTSKSVLKQKLAKPYVIIMDGSAILWCIHWSSSGTVQVFVDSYWHYVSQRHRTFDVCLILIDFSSLASKAAHEKQNEQKGSPFAQTEAKHAFTFSANRPHCHGK